MGSFVSTTSDTCQNTLQELFQSFSLNICRKLLIDTKMHLHITSLASRRSPSELGGQVSVSISQGNWQPEKCRAHTAREWWRNQTSCGSRRVCMFTVERYWGLPLGTPKGLKAPATYLMRSAINFLIWKRRSWLWITLYLYFLKGKREREKKRKTIRTKLYTDVRAFSLDRWKAPTPVFLPGESQGRGSLVGCRLWGCRELDMTEVT